MVKLKKYVRVSFDTEQHARDAWDKLVKNFPALATQQNCVSFSGPKNNTVNVVATGTARDNLIKKFLLSQDGAQPDGCHFKEDFKKAATVAKPSKK